MFSQDFLKRWFGYSRRERTGTFILVAILVIVAAWRSVFFSGRMAGKGMGTTESVDSTEIIRTIDPGTIYQETDLKKNLVTFDPNSATAGELVSLGLTERQATTIINYRNAGGVFRTPGDFRKIYGISPGQMDELVPYIMIDHRYTVEVAGTTKKNYPGGQGYNNEVSRIDRETNGSEAAGKSMVTYNAQDDSNREEEAVIYMIELNGADSSVLVRLKGIGPVLSARIVKYRHLLGGFVSVAQLKEVYGIDSLLTGSLESSVYVDTSGIKRININSAEYADLVRHPYISPNQAGMILRYRSVSGKFSSSMQLVINRILTKEEHDRLFPYLEGFSGE